MRAVPFAVYILTNNHRTVLYTGVTSNLVRRISEHRSRRGSGFTKRYAITRLVYVEWFWDVQAAISREKQIKAGSRTAKVELIQRGNPEWRDLAPTLGLPE